MLAAQKCCKKQYRIKIFLFKLQKSTHAPNANPHKLVEKKMKNEAPEPEAPNANHDKLLTKKGLSGDNAILGSRRGVSAAKAWPQRSIVAHVHEKPSQTSKLS